MPVLVVANKVDNEKLELKRRSFIKWGLARSIRYRQSGRGLADLLDAVVDTMPPQQGRKHAVRCNQASIVGRPNVGKSSMVNAISEKNESSFPIIPGTTRDAIDTLFANEHELVLIDTAGIRRAGKYASAEYYTVLRAIRARKKRRSAIIDAADGVTDGDKRVGGYIYQAGRGCVIVVNKWDMVKGNITASLQLKLEKK